ncbi:DEAD/DEAH box helicase [Bacillus aerolatus]|uniref:DEAD/DEAH box helicase n=1 Tax=Bacillus aerolatus TaxID=2653354 RepID=A0A6I1FRC8_9BACI|nr:DEAD/DEAH box helicase family protein [Bacillus aerolatus]KAB7707128.1 DEAD/DEAH box helicase [Bacillus aerolatus]
MTHTIPAFLNVRDYQKEAITEWFKNEGRGLLEMATGTGKTITALSLSAKLYEALDRLAVVIVTPFTQLSLQWMEDCRNFGLRPVKAFESKEKWFPQMEEYIRAFNRGVTDNISIVTTNATFSQKSFQELLSSLNNPVLLIVDEAHYFGAAKLNKSLPAHVQYRLALTATPNRWMDEEGTENLLSYFGGKVVYTFDLGRAIEAGFLTKYYYYPHLVTLTDEEAEEYLELSNKIKKLVHQAEKDPEKKEMMNRLAIKRARIIYSAQNKVVVLKELLKKQETVSKALFYCGDGKVKEASGEDQRQVDAVLDLVVNEFNIEAKRFTSSESNKERSNILSQFEQGEIDALVAIKCLDEGIDVPATQTAYLISSTSNPKEFIQRRGRVLRKHPDKKHAIIHDFIVMPPDPELYEDKDDELFNIERAQLKKEIERFSEFSRLAINGPEADMVIWEMKENYHLLDV